MRLLLLILLAFAALMLLGTGKRTVPASGGGSSSQQAVFVPSATWDLPCDATTGCQNPRGLFYVNMLWQRLGSVNGPSDPADSWYSTSGNCAVRNAAAGDPTASICTTGVLSSVTVSASVSHGTFDTTATNAVDHSDNAKRFFCRATSDPWDVCTGGAGCDDIIANSSNSKTVVLVKSAANENPTGAYEMVLEAAINCTSASAALGLTFQKAYPVALEPGDILMWPLGDGTHPTVNFQLLQAQQVAQLTYEETIYPRVNMVKGTPHEPGGVAYNCNAAGDFTIVDTFDAAAAPAASVTSPSYSPNSSVVIAAGDNYVGFGEGCGNPGSAGGINSNPDYIRFECTGASDGCDVVEGETYLIRFPFSTSSAAGLPAFRVYDMTNTQDLKTSGGRVECRVDWGPKTDSQILPNCVAKAGQLRGGGEIVMKIGPIPAGTSQIMVMPTPDCRGDTSIDALCSGTPATTTFEWDDVFMFKMPQSMNDGRFWHYVIPSGATDIVPFTDSRGTAGTYAALDNALDQYFAAPDGSLGDYPWRPDVRLKHTVASLIQAQSGAPWTDSWGDRDGDGTPDFDALLNLLAPINVILMGVNDCTQETSPNVHIAQSLSSARVRGAETMDRAMIVIQEPIVRTDFGATATPTAWCNGSQSGMDALTRYPYEHSIVGDPADDDSTWPGAAYPTSFDSSGLGDGEPESQ